MEWKSLVVYPRHYGLKMVEEIVENYYSICDIDDKFNWTKYKINNKLIKNSKLINILLKTKYNKRNKFKNKRR